MYVFKVRVVTPNPISKHLLRVEGESEPRTVSYLVADYSLPCYDSEWRKMLPWAVLMVVIFVVGIPVLLLGCLVRHRVVIKKIGMEIDEALAEAVVLEEMGESIDIDKARALYRQVDKDHSGSIDFPEFAKFWLNHNDGETGTSDGLADIVNMIQQSKDSPNVVESLTHKALDLMNARVGQRSIRRKGVSNDFESEEQNDRKKGGGKSAGGDDGDAKDGTGGIGRGGGRKRRSGLKVMLPVLVVGGGGKGEGGETKGDDDEFSEIKGEANSMHVAMEVMGSNHGQGPAATSGFSLKAAPSHMCTFEYYDECPDHPATHVCSECDTRRDIYLCGRCLIRHAKRGLSKNHTVKHLNNAAETSVMGSGSTSASVSGSGSTASIAKSAGGIVARNNPRNNRGINTNPRNHVSMRQTWAEAESERKRPKTSMAARIRQLRKHPSQSAPSWEGAVMGDSSQGVVLASERAAATGDGVEVMLGVLWRNYKPEYYFFDIINFTFKLVLWATLVFFSYGSQLQIGTALLLCVGRLALHAQFEPYRTSMNNVFDYVTLIVTALFGLGGIMLQSLETSKNLAIIKGDLEGKAASVYAIGVVELALHIMVITVFVAFAVFWVHSLYLRRSMFTAVLQSVQRCVGKRCPCCLRCARRCCPKRCCGGALDGRRRMRVRVSSTPRSPAAPESSNQSDIEMMPCETRGDEGGGSGGIGGDVGGGIGGISGIAGIGGGGIGAVMEEGGIGVDGVGNKLAHMTNPLYDRAQSKSKLSRLASMRTQSQVAHAALQGAHQRRASAASGTSPVPTTRASAGGAGGGAEGRDFTHNPACTGSDELVELANSDARLSRRKLRLKSMHKKSSIML